jgi:acyl-CoA synthetase (AMP-forming)/AMP-acid ligase II
MHDVRLLPQARRSLLGRQPAVLYRDRVLTYRQLDERSTRLANALLALGLTRGDRVAIQARNCPEIVEIECALYKAGLVKAALNPRFTAEEASDVWKTARRA